MFVAFFLALRRAGVPVALTEYLTLLQALKQGVCGYSTDEFYYLSRACLVKDERHLDKFDRVFGETFKGVESIGEDPQTEIPAEWLRKLAEQLLSPEELAQIKALGGFEALMKRAKSFVDSINTAGRSEAYLGDNQFIGATDVAKHRADLVADIAAEVTALKTSFAPAKVTLTGLESRIITQPSGPLELEIFIPYTLTVESGQ